MREQINDQEMENVVGGTVIISKDYNNIGFSTTREKFDLKNCTFKQARNYVDDLLEEHPEMSNAEFDNFVKNAFKAKGWI